MSLQLPKRARSIALVAMASGAAVLVSSCSVAGRESMKRLAQPEGVTDRTAGMHSLWMGAWLAAIIVGIVVWGLIGYACVKFYRRRDDEIPVQTRYNLPLEIFYTIAPIIMVIVFFQHTVNVQNTVLDDSIVPDNTIEVTGQQWSWTFNYGVGPEDNAANADDTDLQYPYSSYVYEAGTASHIPTIVLPVHELTRFNLHSPDVIHDFGVPAFLMKMDVVPGRVNHYAIEPTKIGEYKGKCYELCGVYHSRMLFKVRVVSRADYDLYLKDLAAEGHTSEKPLIGGSAAYTQAGLGSGSETEGGAE